MAQSSDEIIKREIADKLRPLMNGLDLRIFPESSNDDQKPFSQNGLTFGSDGVLYGSCDACCFRNQDWKDPFDGTTYPFEPLIAIEGTDALNRGSSGNAQYQRFHHVLGAVKAGLIGVYYLRKGQFKIHESLFGMAYNASKVEKGTYLVMNDLEELKKLVSVIENKKELEKFIKSKLGHMNRVFNEYFTRLYGTWEKFSEKRSTIIKEKYVIKYAGRNKRNFTESSQRAGHIALGELYLTKYFFPRKKVFYLWPRMTMDEIKSLDKQKSSDKEWQLMRNEKNTEIIGIDSLEGVSKQLEASFLDIKEKPLKGEPMMIFNQSVKKLREGLTNNSIRIINTHLEK